MAVMKVVPGPLTVEGHPDQDLFVEDEHKKKVRVISLSFSPVDSLMSTLQAPP